MGWPQWRAEQMLLMPCPRAKGNHWCWSHSMGSPEHARTHNSKIWTQLRC